MDFNSILPRGPYRCEQSLWPAPSIYVMPALETQLCTSYSLVVVAEVIHTVVGYRIVVLRVGVIRSVRFEGAIVRFL